MLAGQSPYRKFNFPNVVLFLSIVLYLLYNFKTNNYEKDNFFRQGQRRVRNRLPNQCHSIWNGGGQHTSTRHLLRILGERLGPVPDPILCA
jgi:hypothetical protein